MARHDRAIDRKVARRAGFRVRLLHIVPTYLPATRYGGPIYSVHALCAALARRGHEVHVFTTNVDGPNVSPVPLGAPVDMDGVRVTYFPTGMGRRLYRSPDMAAALRAGIAGFDVAHLHSVFLWPTAVGAAAARRANVPCVISPRGMLVGDLVRRKSRLAKTAWITLIERRNLAGAAAIHVTADVEAEEIRRLGLPARRIEVIPNGIDLPPPEAIAAASRVKALADRPMVLSLGRVNWKKGLDRLIPAMSHVPGARLVIAGNDEENYQPTLEALARESGVADRVTFSGEVLGDAKWELVASADIFALPSYSENFGNAVLEAMACGVPVAVTPEVGLAPSVAAAGAGLVLPGDPKVFGEALAGLLADPERRRAMGEAGRRAAVEQFSWDAVASSMSALYGELTRR